MFFEKFYYLCIVFFGEPGDVNLILHIDLVRFEEKDRHNRKDVERRFICGCFESRKFLSFRNGKAKSTSTFAYNFYCTRKAWAFDIAYPRKEGNARA